MSGNSRVCKFEVAFESMQQKGDTVAESTGKNHVRWADSGVNTGKRMNYRDEKRREDKDEKLMHLICWGPNSLIH
ncbi:hypothetical protein L1049_000049 [Liquidambar formosana]|uniref:Uncharacterized protein n=1 Tax=Liquidambar formosana TaxID=63359 RepID=A0AAP0R2B8_LIQFO